MKLILIIPAVIVIALATLALAVAPAAHAKPRICGSFGGEVMYAYGVKRISCGKARPVARKMTSIPADRASFVVQGRRWHWVQRTDGLDRIARRGRARVVVSVQ